MKRIIIGFVAFLIGFSAKTQTIRTLTGLSYTKIDWPTNIFSEYDKKLFGISTGIEINYFEHNFFRLNSRVSYVERGGCNNYDSYISIFYFNYLSLNTNFVYKCNSRIVDPYIFIGPRIDYLLTSSKHSPDSLWNFNRINYGIDFGVGVEKHITDNFLICLDIIYNQVVKDILHVSDSYKITTKYAGVINLS